jgi:hypothetical protein
VAGTSTSSEGNEQHLERNKPQSDFCSLYAEAFELSSLLDWYEPGQHEFITAMWYLLPRFSGRSGHFEIEHGGIVRR